MSVFVSIPKKCNAKRCSNYCTLCSFTCQQHNAQNPSSQPSIVHELRTQMYKLDLEKAEEIEIKLLTFFESQKKQASSRKSPASALLTMPKHLTVQITTNWKILKETGIPDHLTCLLRNLYAGQEASQYRTWNNRLIPNWEKSMSRLYIVTLLI